MQPSTAKRAAAAALVALVTPVLAELRTPEGPSRLEGKPPAVPRRPAALLQPVAPKRPVAAAKRVGPPQAPADSLLLAVPTCPRVALRNGGEAVDLEFQDNPEAETTITYREQGRLPLVSR